MIKRVIALIICLGLLKVLPAQPCTNTGQTPSSAILICGADSYVQGSIAGCGDLTVPVPCNGSFINENPMWFKLTCFTSGTLGFTIAPQDATENFDWQLFDITGRNNDDVFTDPSLFLACNWSPDPGETGASDNGNSLIVCADPGSDLFSSMPSIIQGHEYLLLVSHRINSSHGFTLSITGGTGSVTDPVEPRLFSARLSCDGSEVFVFLNKKMSCITMAPNGSDFSIDGGAVITSALAVDCNNEPETNYVILSLSNPIPPANYTLSIRNGTDGNTIRDRCNRFIPLTDQVPIVLPVAQSALPDSIRVQECSPDKLRLLFMKPVQCNSIATNGSDFIITGPQPVSITNITFTCNTSTITTTDIILHLSSPIAAGGNYQLVLATGTDGNSIVDECGYTLPPGSVIPFVTKASVLASFTYTVRTSCRQDTIYFHHDGNNGSANWNWNFGNTVMINSPTPVHIFPSSTSGQYTAQLVVSNGTCSDTATETISLNNKVVAAFDIPDIICPEDSLHFINMSSDNADSWQWNFGNGGTSNLQSPPALHYVITGRETFYTIKLTAINSIANCSDSIVKRVTVLSSCYIAVPTAFTPNGDGLNDFLHPLNALKADNLVFRVFNRVGQLVFETRDWTRKWDGRINGIPQGTGVYAWMLSFTYRDTGEKVFMKGTTVLIR